MMQRFLPTRRRVPQPEQLMQEALELAQSQFAESYVYFQERLAELELSLEDTGWQRLVGGGEREFSRDGLKRICSLSRLMFLKNPLINRAVTIQASYVFGQGVSISSEDEGANQIIQAFMEDQSNKAELTSHQARMLKEVDLQVMGNIFFVFFSSPDGSVKIRTINVDEIVDIVCNPDDSKEPWFYRRVWTPRKLDATGVQTVGAQQEVYYPDWRYQPEGARGLLGDKTIEWTSPIYHVKVGGLSDMRFGIPETYAALDWATAYKNFLEDWATIARALSRFAWSLTNVQGGARGVAAAKTKLNTTAGTGAPSHETNPPTLPGSTFIGTGGAELNPVRTAGAQASAEDGRRMLLMVAAATGLPETFFGDASVGTLATAKSLDRPTELKFMDRRTLWADVYTDILGYVIAKKQGKADASFTNIDTTPVAIEVSYPPLLEHDVLATVEAIVMAATLDGKTMAGTIDPETVARLLLTALGEDDVDELLSHMDFADVPMAGDEPTTPPPTGPNAPPAAPRRAAEALMLEAARELRRAVQEARTNA